MVGMFTALDCRRFIEVIKKGSALEGGFIYIFARNLVIIIGALFYSHFRQKKSLVES